MGKIEKIRQEIERRIKLYDGNNTQELWIGNTYRAVLSFLDTLSEEPNKSLEEAAEEYFYRNWSDGSLDIKPQVKEDFKAGAEWQKAQMLKEAVEADVNTYKNLEEGTSWAEFVVEMPTNKLGDKVRIIIIKED